MRTEQTTHYVIDYMLQELAQYFFRWVEKTTLGKSILGYVDTRLAIVKTEIRREILQHLSVAGVWMVLFFFLAFFLLFFSAWMAFWLNELCASTHAGFAIVSGVYALLFLVVFLQREAILQIILKKWGNK